MNISEEEIEWARNTVMSLWSELPIPQAVTVTSGVPKSEVNSFDFASLRFDHVDLAGSTKMMSMPLVWFQREASLYYLGSYLLRAIQSVRLILSGDRVVFWDLSETHAVETLREFLEEQPGDPFVERNRNALVRLLDLFDRI